MHANGWAGVRRVKKVRTTVPDPAVGPNRLLVADVGLEQAQLFAHLG